MLVPYRVLLLTLFALLLPAQAQAKERLWTLTFYTAVLSPDSLEENLAFYAGYDWDYRLAAYALSRHVTEFGPVGIEVEGQLVQHLGSQRHQELNALAVVRWPAWQGALTATLAVGEGISFATQRSNFEQNGNTSQLLNYLLFEATLGPSHERWRASLRVHHRSGVYGLFGGVHGGSNALGIGLAVRF